MPFAVDWSRYRLVDLSMSVYPNQKVVGRPFEVKRSNLPDGTHKFDIVNTHTHVGSHIESPWHFYGEGKTCTDYPLDYFMGPAALLRGRLNPGEDQVTLAECQAQLEPLKGTFDRLVVRNDSGQTPLRFDFACVPYFADLGLKVFLFDATIEFGHGLDDGRKFHDLMLGKDALLAEFPAGLDQLDQDTFSLFTMPLRIEGIDSSPCRIFALLDR